jgi:MoaA/NifB/PqqE/SkfB family radical SAM enzyme
MFTLTGIHHLNDENADLITLEENFRELRKKLKRKFPEFRYFAVKELSPDGNWHYHGLWNIYIEFNQLVNIWKEISGAHRVWLSQVRHPLSAVNYIFKYCFKSCTNTRELQALYKCDKRKFSYSSGLLAHNKDKNPYTCEYGTTYSVGSLKEELYNIISTSDCTVDNFASLDYPYFEDLIFNLFDKFIEEHPPNLFYPVLEEKLVS